MTGRRTRPTAAVSVLDGGMGSELRRRGIELSPVCWSALAIPDHAALLEQIHRDYILAGADIVTANTFGTARFVLERAGLGERVAELNRLAVGAARRATEAAAAAATGRTVRVAASLSCLPPAFDNAAYPTPRVESAAYRELVGHFAEAGAELLLLEMMQHPDHAARACEAARASGLPYWVGISCRLAAGLEADDAMLVAFDDPRTSFDAVLEAVLGFEPVGIAIMHTPVAAVAPALTRLRARWAGPLGAYAEIPYPEDPELSPAESLAAARGVTPAAYAAAAADWLDAGVTLVGGCCGTTPGHIAALRRLVDA